MDLSAIQNLQTEDKLQWLQSSVGLAQLQQWLSEGLTLNKIAQTLCIHDHTLYRWRKYPNVAEIVVRSGYAEVKPPKPNLARDPAYRIICGFNPHGSHRYQIIITEHDTALELWESDFIKSYFASFGRSESAYLESYLKEIKSKGLYAISNLYSTTYCKISCKRLIKILK